MFGEKLRFPKKIILSDHSNFQFPAPRFHLVGGTGSTYEVKSGRGEFGDRRVSEW